MPPELSRSVLEIMESYNIEIPKAPTLRPARPKRKKRKPQFNPPREAVFWPEPPDPYYPQDWAEYAIDIWPKSEQSILCLAGDPGQGKTSLVYWLAHHHKALLLKHECKRSEEAEWLFGRSRIKAGTDYFLPGPIHLGWETMKWLKSNHPNYTVWLYFCEANKWEPHIYDALMSLGDDTKSCFVAYTGQRIHWPDAKIIVDFNPGARGTFEMNEAVLDRFHTCRSQDLRPEDEKNVLLHRTRIPETTAENMVRCLQALRKACRGAEVNGKVYQEMDFYPSVRLALDAASCIEHGMDPKKSWSEALCGRVGWEPHHEETRRMLLEVSAACGMV